MTASKYSTGTLTVGLALTLALSISVSCGSAEPGPVADAAVVDALVPPADAPGFCFRPGSDRVRDVFCAPGAPRIDSLASLQIALKLGPAAAPTGTQSRYVQGDYVGILLGHSTALSGRLVSSINPRAILLGYNAAMTFQRGLQQVELAAFARGSGGFNLYLLSFEQACNAGGCTPSDLYTPRVESEWLRISLRDDEDLKNTPQDCRQCHQRARGRPTLLMRELRAPWTHFFDADGSVHEPGVRGFALLQDFIAARGDELYAGLDGARLHNTVGFDMEQIMPKPQPLLFDAPGIEAERWPFRDGKFVSAPLPSPSWEAGYEAFKRGEQLALPYLEVRASDPAKLAALSEAYRRYRSGEVALPDLADVFPDDPMLRARIGLNTEPGATPAQALVQACGSCHNDVLDQSISRAFFNIDLARMDARERELAIERIQRVGEGVMPPPEARQLTAEARAALIVYLRQPAGEDAAFLARAAQLGMAGGAGQ